MQVAHLPKIPVREDLPPTPLPVTKFKLLIRFPQ